MTWLPRSISLRVLFVLVTVLAVLCGWIANRHHQWKQLSRELADMGAYVEAEYGWRLPDHESALLSSVEDVLCVPTKVNQVGFHGKEWSPPTPNNLAMWDYMYPLCSDLGDAQMPRLVQALNQYGGCSRLALTGTQVTDQGLAELKSLNSLESLDLTGCEVSPAGLGELRGLGLQELDLSLTGIGDDAVEALAGLGTLTTLKISDTRITSRGLEQLQARLPHCMINNDPYW